MEISAGRIEKRAHGHKIGHRIEHGRRSVRIGFDEALFWQILDEAISRGWSFSRMVRHLCEASIDGIE